MAVEHYVQNGGTVIAIAGWDFALLASDSRVSGQGLNLSNNQLKIFHLPNNTAVGVTGSMADTQEFVSRLIDHINSYSNTHGRPMSIVYLAEAVSILLYERRIMPYFLQVLLVGLDCKGRGGVYSYDPVGHCEKTPYRVILLILSKRLNGTADRFMLALLSALFSPYEEDDYVRLEASEARRLVSDVYAACTALDPSTGGRCEIWTLRPDEAGTKWETHEEDLRQD